MTTFRATSDELRELGLCCHSCTKPSESSASVPNSLEDDPALQILTKRIFTVELLLTHTPHKPTMHNPSNPMDFSSYQVDTREN